MNWIRKKYVSCVPCVTEGKYLLLGGQHFTAALFTMRNRFLKDHRDLEDLPTPYSHAYGLVLAPNAPWAACRSAAGAHQSLQHDTMDTLTVDVCTMIIELQMEKKQKTGSPWLSDEEVYAALINTGLVRGSMEVLTKAKEQHVSPDDAIKFQTKQVYTNLCW